MPKIVGYARKPKPMKKAKPKRRKAKQK